MGTTVGLAKSIRKIQWRIVRGKPGRPPRVLTVPTANGVLSFSNTDSVVAKGLYIGRAWELDFITETMTYLRREGYVPASPGDLMLDVGANIGMICIAMLRHRFFREALAFEPAPDNFAFLDRNVHQNGMQGRIRTYRCALSDMSGEMLLELSAENVGDHRLRARPATAARLGEEQRQTVSVPVRTLDEVMAADDAPDAERIGLVWVDIQGFEGQFFRGARHTLSRGIPVVCELWPYGMLRAGLTRTDFTEIIRPLFTHLIHVDTKTQRFERLGLGAVAGLFDTFARPQDFGQLILLPDRRGGA
jgi:FkbM family methyltransferase